MSPIELRREMRRLGWRYSRRRKGEATFGLAIGEPGTRPLGVSRVVHLKSLEHLAIAPRWLAEYFTRDAALTIMRAA